MSNLKRSVCTTHQMLLYDSMSHQTSYFARPPSFERMQKNYGTPTARVRANATAISCPYQHQMPRWRPARSYHLSEFSIMHLTTCINNPLVCPKSGHNVPPDPRTSLLELRKCNDHKYGGISTYPHLTRGPPFPAVPFDINKIPYGALRDAELMRLMEKTDDQMILVLKGRYPRCGPLQGVQATDAVNMIYYYRENEHCRAAAPWPQTLKEDLLLKVRIIEVLRAHRKL